VDLQIGRLEDIKHRFWSTGEDHLVQPPLTDDARRDAEQALGVRLPAAYLELLSVQNGGVVTPDFEAFATQEPTSWAPSMCRSRA
jgi:hypothetical protein